MGFLELERKYEFSHEVRRGAQGASQVALGKSGLHAHCEGEVSGHQVLIKSGPGNRGLSACVTTHEATSQIFSLDRPHPEVRWEGWEPLPDKARESTLQSQSGGEKWLR